MNGELDFKKVGSYEILAGYRQACDDFTNYLKSLMDLAETKEERNIILMAMTKFTERQEEAENRQDSILDNMCASRLTD